VTVLGWQPLMAADPSPGVPIGRRLWRAVSVGGERALGRLTLGTTALLLAVVVSCGWWGAIVARDDATAARVEQVRAIGVTLAPRLATLLAAGDAPGVRRAIVETAAGFALRPCRVTLGPDVGSIADADPTATVVRSLPAQWSAGPVDAAATSSAVRFPVLVPGRGMAMLELGGPVVGGRQLFWRVQTGVGLTGAAALAVMLLVYRRARDRFAATEAIAGALAAYAGGERSTAAMVVDPALGPVATAWNDVLAAVDRSARQSVVTRAAAGVRGGERRRAAASELEVACDVISQGLLLIDEHLRVRFVNGAAAVFVGRARDDCIGHPLSDLIPEAAVLDPVRTLAAGTVRAGCSVEVDRPGNPGVGSTLRFTIRPVRKEDSAAAMIAIDDITPQRTAERARNAFVEQVTHELRTPLTTIRLYTETAIDAGETDAAVRANCLNVINVESRRLERIVSEMLSIAEIEAGSLTVHRDDVRLPELFEEIRADYAAQAADKGLRFDLLLPPKLPVIRADRDKLSIAYHNLIANAVKYTPAGGRVAVSVEATADRLSVEVRDTGFGIRPEEHERVFERFYRSTDPRVGQIVGTGLGLPLAREIIRLHGGEVTVQSQLDQGSTFTATLPIVNEA
jgi:signal transduction histidine kinase